MKLSLYENEVSGSTPSELGNPANLGHPALNTSQLTGGIPPELGNLPNLHCLGLGHNQFSGGIPPGLGTLAKLQGLFLGDNQLSRALPHALAALSLTCSWFGNMSLCESGDGAFQAWLDGIPALGGTSVICSWPWSLWLPIALRTP